MRTEVKIGLIVGLVVIGGVAIYLLRQGHKEQQVEQIPWAVKPEAARPTAPAVAARPTTRPAEPRMSAPRPAPLPAEVRVTPRVPTTQPPAPGAQPSPALARPLPPLAETRPAVAVPPALAPSPATGPVSTPLRPEPEAEAEVVVRPVPSTQPVVTPPPRPPALTPAPQEELPAKIREAPRPGAEPTKYTVREGDTLTAIAREHYGDGNLWPKIAAANPGINPDRLLVGQVLIIPPKEKEAAAPPATPPPAKETRKEEAKPTTRPAATYAATYVVSKGDTLIAIARNVLGDGSRWREIYELNRDKIKDPDHLLEGLELRLPPVEKEKKSASRP